LNWFGDDANNNSGKVAVHQGVTSFTLRSDGSGKNNLGEARVSSYAAKTISSVAPVYVSI